MNQNEIRSEMDRLRDLRWSVQTPMTTYLIWLIEGSYMIRLRQRMETGC